MCEMQCGENVRTIFSHDDNCNLYITELLFVLLVYILIL
jgi:hypothetical protein